MLHLRVVVCMVFTCFAIVFFYVGCIYRATTPVNYKINSEHFLISSGRVAAAKLVAEL